MYVHQLKTNAVGKVALIDFLDEGLPQTFNLIKKKRQNQKKKKKISTWEVQQSKAQ